MNNNSSNYIKSIMLNEFENEIEDIFNKFFKKEIDLNQCISILNTFRSVWSSCRFDLKNFGNKNNSIELIKYTENLRVFFPEWFNDNFGKGCKVEDNKNKIDLTFKCIGNGNLKIVFRASDFRNVNNKSERYPVYINYKKLAINDEIIFEEDTLSWHNDFYTFNVNSIDGDIVKLHVEFDNIYSYYPFFIKILSNLNENVNLNEIYNKLKNYIKYEKMMLYFNEFEENNHDLFNFINTNEIGTPADYKEAYADYGSFLNLFYNYKLNSKINSMEKRYNQLFEKQDQYASSSNELLNCLLLDYELKPKRLLANIQTLCLESLNFVSNICKKHDIKWWLDYGNLLGAVRHHDFIPWDDDMDIGMMREDYHQFIDIIHDEVKNYGLDDLIFISYREREKDDIRINSTLQLLVMYKERAKHIMSAVDVFPYDYLKEYDEKTFGISYNNAGGNFYKKLCEGNNCYDVYMGLGYNKVIPNYHKELNLSYEKQKYIIPGVEGAFGYGRNLYELMILETEKVFPLTTVNFGKYTYPAPKDYDYYLTSLYGNYMNIPKSVRLHGRIDKYRKINNINEIFENYIERFKKVNSSF